MKAVSKQSTQTSRKAGKQIRVSQKSENSDFRRSTQIIPVSIFSRNIFLCIAQMLSDHFVMANRFYLSSLSISLGLDWSNNGFTISFWSSKKVHLARIFQEVKKKSYDFKIFCLNMPDIPFCIFSLKIMILSHRHFISIESADFPTVSPTVRQQTCTKMVQFHWSQHLLSNVV